MESQIQWRVVLAVQVAAWAGGGLLFAYPSPADMTPEEAQNYGGMLTTLLISMGLLGVFKARQGKVPLPIIMLMALPAPAALLLPLPPRNILGYYVLSAFSHALLLRTQHRVMNQQDNKSKQESVES